MVFDKGVGPLLDYPKFSGLTTSSTMFSLGRFFCFKKRRASLRRIFLSSFRGSLVGTNPKKIKHHDALKRCVFLLESRWKILWIVNRRSEPLVVFVWFCGVLKNHEHPL